MNKNYIKVKDNPDLVRDKNSNAIINTNQENLDKYKSERNQRLKVSKMVEEFDDVKNDVAEIKNLLLQLLDKKN